MKLYLGKKICGYYELSTQKAGFDSNRGWQPGDGFIKGFCGRKFEIYTGIKLKPGQVKKVRAIKFIFEKEDKAK